MSLQKEKLGALVKQALFEIDTGHSIKPGFWNESVDIDCVPDRYRKALLELFNQQLRDYVLSEDIDKINSYISERISAYPFNFSARICNLEDACLCLECPATSEIYADVLAFSANLSYYSPKKLFLYLWFEPGVEKYGSTIPPSGNGICTEGEEMSFYSGPEGTEGIGECKNGIKRCNENGEWIVIEDQYTPLDEICNGKDDDCDGNVDEDPAISERCSKQEGVCKGSMKTVCENGEWQDCTDDDYTAYAGTCKTPAGGEYNCYTGFESGEEYCFDELDNDCDGLTDSEESICQ